MAFAMATRAYVKRATHWIEVRNSAQVNRNATNHVWTVHWFVQFMKRESRVIRFYFYFRSLRRPQSLPMQLRLPTRRIRSIQVRRSLPRWMYQWNMFWARTLSLQCWLRKGPFQERKSGVYSANLGQSRAEILMNWLNEIDSPKNLYVEGTIK